MLLPQCPVTVAHLQALSHFCQGHQGKHQQARDDGPGCREDIFQSGNGLRPWLHMSFHLHPPVAYKSQQTLRSLSHPMWPAMRRPGCQFLPMLFLKENSGFYLKTNYALNLEGSMDSRSWPPDSADGPWGVFQRATKRAWFGTPNHQARGGSQHAKGAQAQNTLLPPTQQPQRVAT